MKKFFTNFITLMGIFIITSNLSVAQDFDGYALYNAVNDNTTYLIDKNGDIAHTWSNARPCNYAVLLMDSGNIMRGGINQGNQINGAAVGGMVQEIDPQGNVVWEFVYSSADYVSHHDITLMPDGNVLLTAWEVYTNAELSAMGYTGNSNQKYPTHFVEVSQNGTGGEIVWEWHMIDHMIQDVDPALPNYGVVSEHPELMDINVPTGGGGPGPGGGGGDWFHVNGVHYDAEKDQIVFSSRHLSEILIIDHSTTTAEAAGHTGGNSGKGGDILYRWGDPSNYGIAGAQTIAGAVHDARFIPDDGRPRGGLVQFFNNVGVGGSSTTDAIELPLAADGYNYEREDGQPFGPATVTWRHECLDNANGQSAANSMPNGNVFVNLSGSYMYEVDENDNLIWQYNADSQKAFRYTCDHPGVQALIDQGVIEDLCLVNSTVEINPSTIKVSPNPSTGILNLNGLPESYPVQSIQVFDLLGQNILTTENTTGVDLSGQAAGVYFINIRFENEAVVTKKVSLMN